MEEPLFDDHAMRRFIVDGYTQVQADYPPDFHRAIYDKIEAVFHAEGNPGNNILPRIPEIQQIFDAPPVHAALSALLGPDYAMHPHRYNHLNAPGNVGQDWHKDDYIYDQNVRHHRFRWVMAFYYPQDVTEDMGPTAIFPSRQHYNGLSNADPTQSTELALPLCGPAGTVSIVHFDTWHRAMANRSNQKRYMLKFQFTRMEEPCEPAWHNRQKTWRPVDGDLHNGLSQHVWNWLSGRVVPESMTGAGSTSQHVRALRHRDETVRLQAVYDLGSLGEQAVTDLLDALRAEAEDLAKENQTTSSANPQGVNPADLCAAHALSAVGAPAVPALIAELANAHWAVRAAAADVLGNLAPVAVKAVPELKRCVEDGEFWVRRNAAEALGHIGVEEAVPALTEALADKDWRIRFNSAFALAKIGPAAGEAVSFLAKLLTDENRYVRYYATLALKRIGTPEAQEKLWRDLITARWCPATTRESPY